ncbi:MAG TPA: YncE family protein [Terriglobales bacterium]|nr:YncE family protein [Terriglobales bacterium]
MAQEKSRCAWLFFLFLIAITKSVAQAPSALLLVLEKNDQSLAIVDPDHLAVIGRVNAGEDPHEIAVSEDGKLAYISNYGAFSRPLHTLSVVDIVGRKSLPAVELGPLLAPHGLAMRNGHVYFTAEGSKSIGRYAPGIQRVDWTLGLGQNRTHMLVVSGDERRIFTSNVNSNTISILDRADDADVSGWAQTAIPVGKGPEGFDVSPDGRELWAANSHDGTVSIIDVVSRKVIRTLILQTQMANRLKFTPDGKRVLISDLRSGDLVVVDGVTRNEIKRIAVGHGAAGILVAPDGSRAYVAASPDDNVAVVDLKTVSVSGRIATGHGPDGMAWAIVK